MSNNLPTNWEAWRLADVGQWFGGGTPSSVETVYWDGEIPWVSPKDMKVHRITTSADKITEAAIANSAAKLIPEGSVLFVTRSGILAHSFPVALTSLQVTVNQDIKAIFPVEVIDPNYLAWALRAFERKILTSCSKHGTTVHSIEIPALKNLCIPVPPFSEQHRIVAKIEELFSELDKGVDSLTTARDQLKAYRQSVLKLAFDGRLTVEWRLSRGHAEAADWKFRQVAALLSAPLCNGRSVKDRAGGFPVLRLTALKRGAIDLNKCKEGDWDRAGALPFLVSVGDFFVARGNGSKQLVGVGGLVDDIKDEVAFPDTMIRLRLDRSQIDAEYFAFCWNSRVLRDQIERDARTTAGIYKINQDHVAAFTLPVPSLAEQAEIVRILESKLEAADVLETEIAAALARADALRQAILKRAFSGQLVAQNPADEPASELLERIRAERGESGTTKWRNNKNGKREAA